MCVCPQSETNVWDSGVASVLPEVLRCIDLMGQPGQQGDKAMQADIVMCLLSILYLLAPQNYQGFLHSLNGEENIRVNPPHPSPRSALLEILDVHTTDA